MLKSHRFLLLPGVRPFLAGQFLALFAGLFGLSTLSWLVVSQYGEAGIARFYAAQALISFVSYVVLSPIGDRYDKLTIMNVFSCVIAVRSVLLALLVHSGRSSLSGIILLQAISSISMTIILPARASLLLDLVSPEEVRQAAGIQGSIQSAGRILGPACAGLALVSFTAGVCLWVQAGLMVLVCIFNVYVARDRLTRAKVSGGDRGRSWGRDIVDGWRIRLHIPIEKYHSVLSFFMLFAYLPAVSILVPIRIKDAEWGSRVFGATEALLSAGVLVAGLGLSARLSRMLGKFNLFVAALLIQGVLLVLAGSAPVPLLFSLSYFFIGFCATSSGLVIGPQRMLAIPKGYRARLSSSGMTITTIAGSVSAYVCGVGLQHLNVTTVYAGLALIVFMTAIGYLFVPRLKEFLELPADGAELWYQKEYRHAFSHLESERE